MINEKDKIILTLQEEIRLMNLFLNETAKHQQDIQFYRNEVMRYERFVDNLKCATKQRSELVSELDKEIKMLREYKENCLAEITRYRKFLDMQKETILERAEQIVESVHSDDEDY